MDIPFLPSMQTVLAAVCWLPRKQLGCELQKMCCQEAGDAITEGFFFFLIFFAGIE